MLSDCREVRHAAGVIYFLPWKTSSLMARLAGLLPLPHDAIFEMPADIVSADPVRSVVALRAIISDAAERIARHAAPPMFVGFSLGTVPATYLANRFQAPLLSICGAARGEDMIWNSPAAAHVRSAARARGYDWCHYQSALASLNPAANLAHLHASSRFIIAAKDAIVPAPLRRQWIMTVARSRPDANILVAPGGHLGTIIGSRGLQRNWYAASRRQVPASHGMPRLLRSEVW
jgi:hypothetical protein